MSWHYNSSNTKSLHDLDTLVNTVLLSDHFKTEELVGFDAAKEAKKIYDINEKAASDAPLNNSWFRGSVSIQLPCNKVEHCSEADAPLYTVNGLLYRKLLEVIKAAYQENRATQYHTTPFQV